ncbi:MAG: MMPL family transporter, partial [Actinomycetota bacterium]|nr:MMPL family transporter [Actinomycetota bacterium]
MIHIADFCYRRRRYVLLAWVLLLVGVIAAGSALPAEHKANYQTPGAESSKAYALLKERLPQRGGDTIQLVFAGDIKSPAIRPQIDAEIAKAAAQPFVSDVGSPFAEGKTNQISADGRVAYAEVTFDRTLDKLANADANYQKKFINAINPGTRDGLEVEVSNFVAEQQPGSEFIGLIFAALILLLAFGSLLAMGLPIVTALFGLGIGATFGGIASRYIETPEWAAIVASMIGIGVGIDYSLFIITRYRQSLAGGLSPREANITAMGTAGRAVLFAGGTVVISLLGMLTMGLSYLNGVVSSSVLAVLTMLAASLTLLPAILGFVGTNIDKLRVPFTGRESHQGDRAFFYRWSRVVQRRPWSAFLGAALVLLIITLPVLSLRFGFPDPGNNPSSETSRKAYDQLTTGFGGGFNGPLLLVADLKGVSNPGAVVTQMTDAVKGAEGVAFVAPANQANDTAIVTVFPKDKPQADSTGQLVHRLRDKVLPPVVGPAGAKVLVGGFTAISIDQSDYI